MILDYTRKVYDQQSIELLISLFENLKSRGFSFDKVRIENQTGLKREFIKFESDLEIDEFINFGRRYLRNNSVVGDSVLILRNIDTVVGNISNEFITWNADFRIEVDQSFNPLFKESKKQDNLRQAGINIHVDRYKFLFLDFLNKYLEEIRRLIRQRELTSLDLNLSRYVDPFYVIDAQGVDNSYVFP